MTIVSLLDRVLLLLRPALFWAALVLGVLALVDWLVRTRRINAFSPVARVARDYVDPLFKPVERTITRAGGNPQTAPFWALALAILGGIVLISLLEFARDQVLMGFAAAGNGPRGLVMQLLRWTFQILRLALIVRVISSWIRVSPYSPWVRWSFALSEPLIGPLRRVIPPLGMIDITPIVAFLLLGLLEGVVLGAL